MADVQCPVCQGMMDDECTVCFGRGVVSGPKQTDKSVSVASYYGLEQEGEEWKEIPDNKGYQVSNFGRIVNKNTGRLLNVHLNNKNLPIVTIGRAVIAISYSVNRLVAMMFMPDFIPNRQVAFRDGDRLNCRIDNLYQTDLMVRGRLDAQA